ncbi:MAG TPA: hypothetical protein VJ201_08025, partial [Candidatus Babeliales bacterium]|nr:hypothetical protein [Candidatus Babeliales bacterium]
MFTNLLKHVFVGVYLSTFLFFGSIHAQDDEDIFDTTIFAPINSNDGKKINTQLIADGLTSPLKGVVAPGHPNWLYVIDQPGLVWAIDITKTNEKYVVLNVS